MTNTSNRTPLLCRAQIIRLERLLYMEYRPSELAEILNVSVDTVRRSYLVAGCPFRLDSKGHYWIVGTEFKSWAEEIVAERKRKKTNLMLNDEAWCFKCNRRVKLINPKSKRVNHHLELMQSNCPECGTKVNRAREAKR